jgi:two-component system NtrC family sensor kinase
MRLALKLMSAMVVALIVLLALHSYLTVLREIEVFEQDMERRAYLLGRVLASSTADIWRYGGSQRVADILKDANTAEDVLKVRWVWLDAPAGDPFVPQVDTSDLTDLVAGHEVWIRADDDRGREILYAYFPVAADSTRQAALELAQPLAPMHRYIRATIVRNILLLITLLLIGGGAVWWLGTVVVGRPVEALVQQARRVGEGDLTARTTLGHGHDELTELAASFNRMVEGLEESQERLARETARRFEALEQLHHAERLATVGKLASGVAHELGTPLNVITARAGMIAREREQMTAAEIDESAGVIREQGERMTRLIRNLLDFARRPRPQKAPAQLGDVVRSVTNMLKPLATQRGVIFHCDALEPLPPVFIDEGQIQQVLSNLLINAVHAMPRGGSVEIRTLRAPATPPADRPAAAAGYAAIVVKDEGTGITPENQRRIFTPFFSTKDPGEGTGLGLSIAYGIVEEHGGWIAVTSEPGRGSTFTVYLPMDAPPGPAGARTL